MANEKYMSFIQKNIYSAGIDGHFLLFHQFLFLVYSSHCNAFDSVKIYVVLIHDRWVDG